MIIFHVPGYKASRKKVKLQVVVCDLFIHVLGGGGGGGGMYPNTLLVVVTANVVLLSPQ